MTIAVFLFSLLGAWRSACRSRIALLLCGVALMYHLGMFDRRSSRRTSSTAPTAFR
jgi:hypothetical protein